MRGSPHPLSKVTIVRTFGMPDKSGACDDRVCPALENMVAAVALNMKKWARVRDLESYLTPACSLAHDGSCYASRRDRG